jgi:hypothetical protein
MTLYELTKLTPEQFQSVPAQKVPPRKSYQVVKATCRRGRGFGGTGFFAYPPLPLARWARSCGCWCVERNLPLPDIPRCATIATAVP